MSFGASMRFEATTGTSGKPVIFWDQQAHAAKNKVHSKKKFSYKKLEQKFPLRSQQQVAPEDNAGATQNSANARVPRKPQSINRNAVPDRPGNQKTGQRAKKSTGPTSRNPAAGKPKDPVERNTVTLTEQQLKSILSTIGSLSSGNTELTSKAVENLLLNGEKSSQQSVLVPANREDTPPPVSVSPDPTSPRQPNGTDPRHVEPDPSTIPGLEGQPPASRPAHVAPDPATIPGLVPHPPAQPKASPRPESETAVKAPLTKAERKRLQWEKDRAEAQKTHDYNPWGRPGAGAPVKDREGNVLADYNQRKEGDSDGVQTNQDSLSQPEPARTQPPVQAWNEQTTGEYMLTQGGNLPSAGLGLLNSTQPLPSSTGPQSASALQPAALRSSFTLGEVSPDENRFMSAKERQKKQWLEDLEKQREEARLRKLAEKEKWRQEGIHDTWADKLVGHQALKLPNQTPKLQTQTHQDDHSAVQNDGSKWSQNPGGGRVSSAPVPGHTQIPEGADDEVTGPSGFLRSGNALMDPQQVKDLEEKRKRHLEHQEAIRAQVEEKEQLKRKERERKLREEQEEEARLQRERDTIQQQFEREQMKAKQKEELQQERLVKLKEAMDQAQEQAEREKHERRLQRLAQAGHDTVRLHANFEAGVLASSVSLPDMVHNHDNSEAKMTPRGLGASSVVHVEPTYVPGLAPTPQSQDIPPSQLPQPPQQQYPGHRVGPSVSQAVQNEPYTENRVLTPTQYRAVSTYDIPISPKREFGTQTEFRFSGPDDRSPTDVDIQYKGPFHPARNRSKPDNGKKVRVKSAPDPQPKEAPVKQKGTVKISERPKWGQSGAPKKQVKQSEKDPNYEKRRKRVEAARIQRQQEMLALAEKNAKHIPGSKTAASRARSRSPPTSVRARSKSPPLRGQEAEQQAHSPPYVPPLSDTDLGISHGSRSRTDSHPPRRTSHRDEYTGAVPMGHNHIESPRDQAVKAHNYNPQTGQTGRSYSPPIPTLRHRLASDGHMDRNGGGSLSQRSKYGDVDPTGQNIDFIPFVRSQSVLDPAHADDPLPVSREPTVIQRARQTYIQNHQPGSYGHYMDNFEDERIQDVMPDRWEKDPIMNPSIITDHPTVRQDRILQQLSSLRLGLLQKQQEYATGLTPSEAED